MKKFNFSEDDTLIEVLSNDEEIISILNIQGKEKTESLEMLTFIVNNDLPIPGYIDPEFYFDLYEDVKNSGMSAIQHFKLFGQEEGRIGYPEDLKHSIRDMRNLGRWEANISRVDGVFNLNYSTIFDDYLHLDSDICVLSYHWFNSIDSELLKSKYKPVLKKFNSIKALEYLMELNESYSLNDLYDHEIPLFIEIIISRQLGLKNVDDEWSPSDVHFFDIPYLEKYTLTSYGSILEAFKDWFRNHRDFVPNNFFNSNFYTSAYKDINGIKYPFEHYLLHGRYEGRKPNQFVFHIEFGLSDTCRYTQYPLEKLYPFLADCDEEVGELLDSVFLNLSVLVRKYSHIHLLWKFINNKYFIDYYDCDSLAEAIKCWMDDSFSDDAILLFDTSFVASNLSTDLTDFVAVFSQWVDSDQLSTTPLFDENFYLNKYLDLKKSKVHAFRHFLEHGQFENRAPCLLLDPMWICNTYNSGTLPGLQFFASTSQPVKPSPGIMPISWTELKSLALDISENQWFDLVENNELREQFEKVTAIDPRIKLNDPQRIHTLMPYNMDFYHYIRDLEKYFKDVDVLIFRDSINFGGADVVLGYLYNAIKSNQPNSIIKVVSFGHVDELVLADRNIDADDVFSLSSLKGEIPHVHQSNIVYDLIVGSNAKKVYNVNSYGAWEAFANYGKSLSGSVSLYGYLFCDDRDEFGNIAGYPTSYFFSTIEYMTKVYLDSYSLQYELESRGAIIDRYRNKVEVVKTPFESKFKQYIPAENSSLKVAWAGRFDEQKRPDLLIEIAKLMPETEFHVWGKAILSKEKYDFSSCQNIKLHGLYGSIDEVLHQECNLYLYTSGWDGIPTILLDMVDLGLPIVASNVGGVSEALPEWSLIDGNGNAQAYVDKMMSISNNISDYCVDMFNHKNSLMNECTTEIYNTKIGKR